MVLPILQRALGYFRAHPAYSTACHDNKLISASVLHSEPSRVTSTWFLRKYRPGANEPAVAPDENKRVHIGKAPEIDVYTQFIALISNLI